MRKQVTWLAAAAGLGFLLPAIFSGLADLERDLYLLVYVPTVAAFCSAYLLTDAPDGWVDPRSRWASTLVAAVTAGTLLALSVLRQPAGERAAGSELFLDLAWSGVAYGVVDALLLTVLPVAAVFGALGRRDERDRGTLGVAMLALTASLAVTAAYHLGYEEFRGAALIGPLLGNGVVAVAYLAARNPVAPCLAHVAMHVAAVMHGMETAVQLPPHG